MTEDNILNVFQEQMEKQKEFGLSYEKALLEIEKLRLKLADKFIPDDIDQKTELSQSERIIISILEYIAENPYSISEKLNNDTNYAYHCSKTYPDYKITPLKIWIRNYLKYGLSVNRKSRKESVEVMRSALQKEIYPQDIQSKPRIWER